MTVFDGAALVHAYVSTPACRTWAGEEAKVACLFQRLRRELPAAAHAALYAATWATKQRVNCKVGASALEIVMLRARKERRRKYAACWPAEPNWSELSLPFAVRAALA